MPRKTQPRSGYPSDSMINVPTGSITHESPSDIPSAKTLRSWLSLAGLSMKESLQRGNGFLLNAKEPEAKDKVSLSYNQKAFHSYNDKTPPYYIGFSQWFYDGAWMGNEPGWIKISFSKTYIPEDALIIIRLSGYGHMFGNGSFDILFEGKIISVPHTAGYNKFQAVTIPLVINKSHPNRRRTQPLGDILISARNLGSWKFYDARYDSLQRIISK